MARSLHCILCHPVLSSGGLAALMAARSLPSRLVRGAAVACHSAGHDNTMGTIVAKIRYKKRIMPRDGRIVNGCYQSDYSQGVDAVLMDRLRAIHQQELITPLCQTSRSRAFWSGYRRGNGDVVREREELGRLKATQMRTMMEAFAREGMDLSAYLKAGGRLSDALATLHARGLDNRPVGGRARGTETARA